MVRKADGGAMTPWLPRWATTSLGLYLGLSALHAFVGRQLHFLPLYLLPVLLAARGGVGPGVAMLAAAATTGSALEVILLQMLITPGRVADLALFLAVGG